MVPAVDQGNVNRELAQACGRVNAAETAAYDDDARPTTRHPVQWLSQLGQIRLTLTQTRCTAGQNGHSGFHIAIQEEGDPHRC